MNEEDIALLHPRENSNLYGHAQAEEVFLKSYDSGNLPHAWLISGPRGIGKATLAYRFARFLLNSEAEEGEDLFGEELPHEGNRLQMDEENSIFRRVANGSHSDLTVLEVDRSGDKKEIHIDDVRVLEHFFSHTSSESKWRVVIIDSADEMNRNAANALLKTLEEPPRNTIILLISHAPGRLLPTIRSRCRFLKLRPLSRDNAIKVMGDMIPELSIRDAEFAVDVSDGSPGFAAEIYSMNGLEIYNDTINILKTLPDLNIMSVQEMGDALAKKENAYKWRIVTYMLGYFLAKVIEEGLRGEAVQEFVEGESDVRKYLLNQHSIDHLADLWEKVSHISADKNRVNMDVKGSTIQLFGVLQN